jgi:hypothetical protein
VIVDSTKSDFPEKVEKGSPQARISEADAEKGLHDDLKTGQSWSLQNRPVERIQDNFALPRRRPFRQAFLHPNDVGCDGAEYTNLTWAKF